MKNEDYLWDRSGEPDRDVARLEESLSSLRHCPSPPQFPEAEFEKLRRRRASFWRFSSPRLALAAAVAVLMAVVGYREISSQRAPANAWAVTRLEGSPRLDSGALRRNARIAEGQSLVTDSASRARIDVADIGEVELGPNSRLRVVQTRPGRKELALDRGFLHARISAPPRQFYVNTPSAMAVDLGCEYDLSVDDSGAGLIRVTMGWVQFESGVHKVLIPAGALARTRPGLGPGTPFFAEVSAEFQSALEVLDFASDDPAARRSALRLVLEQARRDDSLSMFYLLFRVSDSERALVYDWLAKTLPPPSGVTREAVLRLDQSQIDAWMDAWGLDHPARD